MIVHAKTLRAGDRVRPVNDLREPPRLGTVLAVDQDAREFRVRYDDEARDRVVRWGGGYHWMSLVARP